MKLDSRLTTLHTRLPKNSAFIVLTGHPLAMRKLMEKRTIWERLVKTLGGTEGISGEGRWLAEDDRKLEEAVAEAREGMTFFCVK